VYLELYFDVESREVDGYLDETPFLEIYTLNQEFAGELDPSQFTTRTSPTVRNVVVGQNRRVVIEITEIVQSYIDNPSGNHGLIIGSLTGNRSGLFSIKTGMFANAGIAKITFFTQL
jgi:hypothetical protein